MLLLDLIEKLTMHSLLRLLLFWQILVCALHAYDLSTAKRPQGPLGVTLDYSLATTWPDTVGNGGDQSPRSFIWTSHLTFVNPVSEIRDGQLWQLALDAYAEMIVDRTQYGIGRKKTASAMAVLAWGNQIIFASSQTGPAFTYKYPGTPVLESLQLCQIVWRDNGPTGSDKEHRTGGKCAEPTAAHLYYFSQINALPPQSARVGTVVLQGGSTGAAVPTDPCGDPSAVRRNPF